MLMTSHAPQLSPLYTLGLHSLFNPTSPFLSIASVFTMAYTVDSAVAKTAAAAAISTNSSSPLSHSPSSSSSPPPTPNPLPPPVVISPCAACKILRRRCAEKCVLAPYFPPTEPAKFTIAHRVFGASNIIKFLQELPESQRADAVSSMVYEASARIRDPVYGCAGAICHLQKQVNELQAQLAKAQAELVNMQCQQTNLMALLCVEMAQSPQHSPQQSVDSFINTPQSYQAHNPSFLDESSLWGPLWT